MKKLYKKYKSLLEEIEESEGVLISIVAWEVSEAEKTEERRKVLEIIAQCKEDLKLVLSQIAKQAGDELSKLCLYELAY